MSDAPPPTLASLTPDHLRSDPNDDTLDAGICDGPDVPRAAPTADGEETLALVLFADIDFLDPAAVREREREWNQLQAHHDAEAAAAEAEEPPAEEQPDADEPGLLRRIADKVEDVFDRDNDKDKA